VIACPAGDGGQAQDRAEVPGRSRGGENETGLTARQRLQSSFERKTCCSTTARVHPPQPVIHDELVPNGRRAAGVTATRRARRRVMGPEHAGSYFEDLLSPACLLRLPNACPLCYSDCFVDESRPSGSGRQDPSDVRTFHSCAYHCAGRCTTAVLRALLSGGINMRVFTRNWRRTAWILRWKPA